jgi:hypothetical protein
VNPQALSERNRIVAEIDSIIRELETIVGEIQGQKGIGVESCVASLRATAARYRGLRSSLWGMR